MRLAGHGFATLVLAVSLFLALCPPGGAQGLPKGNPDVTGASSTQSSLERSYLRAQQLRQQLQQQAPPVSRDGCSTCDKSPAPKRP